MSTETRTKVIDMKIIGFSTVAAILGASFAIAMSTSAATGDMVKRTRGCDSEQHEAIETAIEEGDYDTWKELMSTKPGWRGKVTEVVTEENFATFKAMHAAMEAGDFERADVLRTELGLPERDGVGAGGMHRGGGWGGMHRPNSV